MSCCAITLDGDEFLVYELPNEAVIALDDRSAFMQGVLNLAITPCPNRASHHPLHGAAASRKAA